jgi:hypothetical protein
VYEINDILGQYKKYKQSLVHLVFKKKHGATEHYSLAGGQQLAQTKITYPE